MGMANSNNFFTFDADFNLLSQGTLEEQGGSQTSRARTGNGFIGGDDEELPRHRQLVTPPPDNDQGVEIFPQNPRIKNQKTFKIVYVVPEEEIPTAEEDPIISSIEHGSVVDNNRLDALMLESGNFGSPPSSDCESFSTSSSQTGIFFY